MHHALLGQHLAVAQHPVADVAHRAVDVEVAGGHRAVAVDPVAVQAHGVPVLAQQDLVGRDPHGAGQAGVVDHVAVLAVDRDERLGPGHRDEGLQLALAGVARSRGPPRRPSGPPRRPGGGARR